MFTRTMAFAVAVAGAGLGCSVAPRQDAPAAPPPVSRDEPPPRPAQDAPAHDLPPQPAPVSFEGGLGFTADPDTFLLALEGLFWVQPHVGVGPLVQLGVSDRRTLVAPSVNVRGVIDLEQQGLERVKPYVEGGVGFTYLHEDHRRGDDDDLGLLLDVGGGLNFQVNQHLDVGTGVLFNFMPVEVLDERFFFSWRIVSLTCSF
ncbi:MAG: hypothetical protein U1E76_14340 [Planctomycetota bacterium]